MSSSSGWDKKVSADGKEITYEPTARVRTPLSKAQLAAQDSPSIELVPSKPKSKQNRFEMRLSEFAVWFGKTASGAIGDGKSLEIPREFAREMHAKILVEYKASQKRNEFHFDGPVSGLTVPGLPDLRLDVRIAFKVREMDCDDALAFAEWLGESEGFTARLKRR